MSARRSTGDPFEPAAEHVALLEQTRERARADARLHAEDLLERELPIVEEAESQGHNRVVHIELRRSELIEREELAVADAASAIATAQERVRAAEAALAHEGVSADEFALNPLNSGLAPRALLIGATVALVGAIVAGTLAMGALGALLSILFAAILAVAAMTVLARQQGAEPGRIDALRRERAAASADLRDAAERRSSAEAQLTALPRRAATLVMGEQRFAEQFVSCYVSELFSALPPGALVDGRGVATQRKPRLEIPSWARSTS